VAKLSRRAAAGWVPRLPHVSEVRVVGMVQRRSEQGEEPYRKHCAVKQWEIPLVEIISRDTG
jgi:ATP-dependent DNA helicase RecQ